MKRGGGLHSAGPDWWPPTQRPRATPGGLIAASVTCLSRREGVPPCLRMSPPLGGTLEVHRTSWRIPFQWACRHVLGTGVPRRLGVAHSASSPKAAQALGCSLTPRLRISFGRVTCMARAASVPGLWTLGFLLLCGACVWVWVVLGLGFWLRPATPGWGDGVCVCLRARSACTPPLLAAVCSVCVCAWARVSAAPRHSWLGCWGLCVLVCPLRLYPASPGWGVRCGCVCSGSGFGCAPPFLAEVLGFVCLCAHPACSPPLLAGLCGVGVCASARISAAPRHTWLGRWGVCVFVCALRLYHANPGLGVRCVRVCLGPGFRWAPPLLAGVFGCVCLCVRSLLVPRHSWLECAVSVCVLGLGFRLHPATPGWGVGVCVCLCAPSACTPPLLAGVCCVGVGVAWAQVWAAPCHSWLGCWGVCVCVPAPLVPRHSWLGHAVWVCVLGLGFGCALTVLAGLCGVGVCAWAWVWAAPRQSGLGCAVWVCVLGLGFRLHPATPGWGVGVCVCLCVRFACSPLLLAGVCGVGVCVRALVSAAPRHSWLGCWGVCVLVCALRLYPAIPGWVCVVGVCAWARVLAGPRLSWRGCWGVRVCVPAPPVPRHSWLGFAVWACVNGLGFWRHPATPGWGDGVCVFVCGLRLYPATPGWGVRCRCVCLGSGFGCAPPLLPGVFGFVCVCVCAPLVPRNSWLGCAVWVCLLGLGFRLGPAIPGWSVGMSARLRAHSSCTPPLLAGVCGVGVCASARVSAAPRHSWLGCRGVCVCLCARFACTPPLLAGTCCVGVILPGTCCDAVVGCVLCALPGFAAPGGCCRLAPVCVPWLWPVVSLTGVPGCPAWCAAPRPLGSLSVLRSASLTPWCLSPRKPAALLGGCAGQVEAGQEPGSLCLPLAPAEAGALGLLPSYLFRAPRWGCP